MNVFKRFVHPVVAFTFLMTPGIAVRANLLAQEPLGAITIIRWSTDGQRLAWGNAAGAVTISDVFGASEASFVSAYSIVLSLAWSPSDQQLAVGHENGDAYMWSLENIHAETPTLIGVLPKLVSLTRDRAVKGIEWNPSGDRIVTVMWSDNVENTLRLWDANTLALVGETTQSGIFDVMWSPDGRFLATSEMSGAIRIFDSALVEQHLFLAFEETDVLRASVALTWSPDGRKVAAGDSHGNIYVWDIESGERLARFPAHGNLVSELSWTVDGAYLVSTGNERQSEDGRVNVWETQTFTLVESYESTRTGFVGYADVSPYGGQLAFVPRAEQSQVAGQEANGVILNGAVQIVVPAPSSERLKAIADLCLADAAQPETFAPLAAALEADTSDLAAFVAGVRALPEGAIPPGCAADVLAVAAALGG